jgi:phosphoglycerate dehydrogenase-like enzyme
LITANNKFYSTYRSRVEAANLPELEIVENPGPDVDIVFGEPTLIGPILNQLPALTWVQATWAGVEPLLGPDLRRNYILTNARGVFGGLMSEYVFGYLLMYERRILQRLEAQKQARWDASRPGRLRGKTIGLLGVGSIGAHLAGTARHFGMQVRGYTLSSETCPDVWRYFHGPALTEFAWGLDYLVSVLPDTGQTRRIVDAALLASLPAHAIFINAGRGSAVDETALAAALEAGQLAAAVLDVFEQEPLPAGHVLWRTKNVIITSHSAAPSFPDELSDLFIDNYQRLLAGQALKYPVDFERGY